MRGDIRNLLCNVPPRMFKSGLCSVNLAPWVWIKQPSLQFFYVSYAQELSVRDSVKARRIIESKWYQGRWGSVYDITSDQNTKIRFDNNKGGYRLSSSVDAKITGEGGDCVCVDDPNNVRDRSDVMLKSAQEWWEEVMPTRLNDFKTGRRLLVQQRMHERDISGIALSKDEGEWTKFIVPMEFETKRRCVTVVLPSTKGRPWRDPRQKEGELLAPERVGDKELKLLKRELGSEYAISGQLQQRPAPVGGGIIKKHWFRLWTAPLPPRCKYTLMSVDTAITDNKSSAYNVATTWGIFDRAPEGVPTTELGLSTPVPHAILLSMWRLQCGYETTRAMLQRLAKDYLDDDWEKPRNSKTPKKPDVILIEAKVTGLTLIQDMRRAGVPVWPYNPDRRGDKTQRVHLCTPILAAQRVWLPGDPARDYNEPRAWAEPFLHQCVIFPNGQFRDIIDTMTQAIDHLNSFNWISHPDDEKFPEPVRDLEDGHGEDAVFY